MTQILAAAFFLLVLPISFWGWGMLFCRLTGIPRGKSAVTIALGVATVIFIGGWLNWLGLAYTPPVLLVLIGGICVSFSRRRKHPINDFVEEGKWVGLGALLMAVAFLVLLIFTQLPPQEYNPADDLQKYFTWPTRMLATGTMVFSSTSAIGAESLGGQAFLHGVMLSILPINYLAGVDGVFGIALCFSLVFSLAQNRMAQVLGVLAILVIHPEIVNISTVYLGSALIMAALSLAREPTERSSLGQAVIYAALLACKPTFVIFVVPHFIAEAVIFSNLRVAARSMIRTGAWCVFFLSPWILLHVHHWSEGIGYTAPVVASAYHDAKIGLFSRDPLFYGGSMLAYSVLVFGASLVAAVVVWVTRRQIDTTSKQLIGAAIILPVGYLVVFYISGPLLIGQAQIVRYYTPVIIGLAAAIIVLSLSHLPERGLWFTTTAAAFAGSLALFAPSFGQRAGQMIEHQNQLSYSAGSSGYFHRHNNMVLTGIIRESLEKAQNTIPAGAPLLAWVDTAYQLNFSRNPIYDVETAGTSNPWAVFPKVRYILWEKGNIAATERLYLLVNNKDYKSLFDEGYHERQIAARWLAFYKYVERLTRKGRIIGQEGTIVVYELTAELEGPLKF